MHGAGTMRAPDDAFAACTASSRTRPASTATSAGDRRRPQGRDPGRGAGGRRHVARRPAGSGDEPGLEQTWAPSQRPEPQLRHDGRHATSRSAMPLRRSGADHDSHVHHRLDAPEAALV